MSQIRFLVFSDLHYKKKMYPTKVSDLQNILDRALEEQVQYVLHEGDFCNDYSGSPEILALLKRCPLPVFGVYGNHELEAKGNSMEVVTPFLTNVAHKVVWGREDGTIGDGTVGYYYYDTGDFRFVFLDTNHSLMPDGVTWEHNRTASWGYPAGNSRPDSLGPVQLAWLETVLMNAAEEGKQCIINAHASFVGSSWPSSPDHQAVRALYAKANAKRRGTVRMSLNGHYHSTHVQMLEEVCYLDVNVAINGWWQPEKFYPYGHSNSPEASSYTFEYTGYDGEGNKQETVSFPYADLAMGEQTLFFESPLSCVITLDTDGKIEGKGSKTDWAYGKTSPWFFPGIAPEISDFYFDFCEKKGEKL